MSSFSLLAFGVVALAVMAACLIAMYELCFRIGRRMPDQSREAKRSQIDLAVTALLTLLGLLLAFSFELGASQFEKRRDLVVDDANALSTAYLRADLLPPPHRDRVRGLLREYLAQRAAVVTPEELKSTMRGASTLRAEMWSEAALSAHETDTPGVALFIDALNRVIDLEETQVNTELFQRMPRAIFWVLFLVSLVSLGMFGIRGGLDRARGLFSASVLTVIIMIVIVLIDSLDDPASRLFEVSRQAIQDAQRMMANVPHHPTEAMQP